MYDGIAILGLNGSGKSTLAHALAKSIGYREMDVEDYYFPAQKTSRYMALEHRPSPLENTGVLPFSISLSKEDVQYNLISDIREYPRFILCGVTMNWCEEILSKINVAFWIQTPKEERLKRIEQREFLRFGQRVLPGGDMYEQQKAFRETAAQRDLKSLEENIHKLNCPVHIIDGTMSVQENVHNMLRLLQLD